jgi:hypothetical protein
VPEIAKVALRVDPLDRAQTSAQRKLNRGIEHVNTLLEETHAFESDGSYVFRFEPEMRSAHEIAYRCFAAEEKPPPDHWPLLAGEAIQNLRSALDHAVWSAWKAVPQNSGEGHHTQFPITLAPHSFSRQAGKYLTGVPQAIQAAIEETQPYRRLPQAPEEDVLALLQALSNIDKHRTLAAVACAVDFEGAFAPEDVRVRWEKGADGRELGHGETEVSVKVATSDREITDMEVGSDISCEVRIEGTRSTSSQS